MRYDSTEAVTERSNADDLWGDYAAAAVFTFDLDAGELWRSAGEYEAGFERFAYRGRYGPEVGVPRILELFEKYDLPCTFYIPGKVAEEWPETVQLIHEHGHEIAHHGYTHVSLRDMEPDQEEAEFKRTLDVFEDLTGETPVGFRTPGGITERTFELLEEADMTYDSSFQDSDVPYWRDDADLLEIPNAFLLDDFVYWGYNMVPSFDFQAGISPNGPIFETWEDEFRGLHERNRLFMLTMHPQVIGRASRIDALESLLQRTIETGDTWVTTSANVADHWATHHG